jgi:hypothetical protein
LICLSTIRLAATIPHSILLCPNCDTILTDSPNTLTNLATSYILLTPYNYNDYDVSIESRNSVLLNDEGTWVIQESVKEVNCVPPFIEEMSYEGVKGWDEAGQERKKGGEGWRELVGEFRSVFPLDGPRRKEARCISQENMEVSCED